MASPARTHGGWGGQKNSLNRKSSSPSPAPSTPPGTGGSRILSSPLSSPSRMLPHARNQSLSQHVENNLGRSNSKRGQSGHTRHASSMSATFAPQFISTVEMRSPRQRVNEIEGENDLTGNKYVWVKDANRAFIKGLVLEENEGEGKVTVRVDDKTEEISLNELDKVNPTKFDKANDMAELTFLNEGSVIHNLRTRYESDLIYTYSGLFLVAINPYCPLSIYTKDFVNMYRGRIKEDTKPHIFATADEAFRKLVEEGQNQSILVTGESGAGKTENTKKVIQYLAAVAATDTLATRPKSKPNLSQQILKANPILEAFGNAQTGRNNNSSRFGKFIRIQFTKDGQIAGAFIDWYLLEKSRVVKLNPGERNYHIFYQLLRGCDAQMRNSLLLSDADVSDFDYTRHGNGSITGVSDYEEWQNLIEAFKVMGFSNEDQKAILRTVAAVLWLGNIRVSKESLRGDQAALDKDAIFHATKACQLLGIPCEPFVSALLHPRVKAGRELVEKVQTPEQVRSTLDALAKGIYERGFGDLVDKINAQLNQNSDASEDTRFIGVLDIAGFEIFEENSFEQLCINYTNEKLQQFFNHHMFVIEQEEYAKERIDWNFIDFGKDLQPTIDLIELSNPIGIFSCLDEDSVMPKATDKSFTDKLHTLWDRKTPKYRRSMLSQGFVITHYAAEVEYTTDGWLDKNKDPLSDNLTRLLAQSSDKHIANLFVDCADHDNDQNPSRRRVKKGLFRTVAQRHKEQLFELMARLHSTHPHFVRCILPNHNKKPKNFNANLVLDQLRCNGVLEGIRIARTGFPNRLPFAEFRARYEVLCQSMPKGVIEDRPAVTKILQRLDLNESLFRIGLTKVFFRAGVLADLEEQRDSLIREIFSRFQSLARGFIIRRTANKTLYRTEAARIIRRNFQVYLDLQSNPWWRLFVQMKPMLGATRQATELKRRDDTIINLENKIKQHMSDRQKLEQDRRRADNEMKRIQQTLDNERALALDKEAIFQRLQEREAELSDKLGGALEDQEALEDQLDAMMQAKKTAEDGSTNSRSQLDQAGKLIENLEGEKKALIQQCIDLRFELEDIEHNQAHNTELEDRYSKMLQTANENLKTKENRVTELEHMAVQVDRVLKKQIADLEAKVVAMEETHDEDTRQRKEALHDARTLREQVANRDSSIHVFEKKISELEAELNSRNIQYEDRYQQEFRMLNSQISMKERKIQDLETKLNKSDEELSSKLAGTTRDLQSARRQQRELETIVDSLRQQQSEERSSRDLEYEAALSEVSNLKSAVDEAKRARASLEVDLRDSQSELEELRSQHEEVENSQCGLLQQISQLKETLETEQSKSADAATNIELYKSRADEYFNKLEQAEVAITKASRAEAFAKSHTREAEENYAFAVSERSKVEFVVEDLHKQLRSFEGRVEDLAADLEGAKQARKRLQNELEDYRSQRENDIEDQESSAEQTRQKYHTELSTLTSELARERENAMELRNDNGKLRDELDTLRSQWDEEVINSSSWAKEKARMEKIVEDLSDSRDETANACEEAQGKISSLSAELRNLRSSNESTIAERDQLLKEKQSLESRLTEAGHRYDELARCDSPSMRSATGADKDFQKLKSTLAHQEDVATAAVGKMRRAEHLTQEVQKELAVERESNANLHKDKVTLEKTVKDLQLKLVDLETKGYPSASNNVKYLNGRIRELQIQLDAAESERQNEQKAQRIAERLSRDLQSQLERKEGANYQLGDDLKKCQAKTDRLLQTIEELQSAESSHQLSTKRAERELREEREKSLRLERELEGWKGLRLERRESQKRTTSWRSALGEVGNGVTGNGGGGGSIRSPKPSIEMSRDEGLKRQESLTKGFL